MESYLIYFAKVNGLLILFYLMYVLFLQKETFFTTNRWYLLAGLFISITLPLLTFTKTIYIEPSPIPEFPTENIVFQNLEIIQPIQESQLDWSLLLLGIYGIISLIIVLKIGIELVSFFKKINNHEIQKIDNYSLVDSNSSENPFSFFNYIVINKNRFSENELRHILIHESIHVAQKHSLDVLLSKLFCALLWANPIIWLYRKAILQNLEFIADKLSFEQIENKYDYQRTLLKVVTHQHNLSITNQFYQSLIKKRIVMLHTNQSQKKNVLKYAFILPALVGFMLLFQIETVAQVKESKSKKAKYAVSTIYTSLVTKNTSDKELKELEKTFSGENHKLIISNVKRNKNNEIIAIKLVFDSGRTYVRVFERKSTEPITNIKIYVDKDNKDEKTFGFEDVNDATDFIVNENLSKQFGTEIKVKKINEIDVSNFEFKEVNKSTNSASNKLYIINNKEYLYSELSKVNVQYVEKINVLNKEEGIKKYGDKGKNGVVIIEGDISFEKDGKLIQISKAKENSIISEEPKIIYYLDDKIISKEEKDMINIEIIESVNVIKENDINKINITTKNSARIPEEIQIYVNGEKVSKEEFDKIAPSEIESINVLKDKKRIEIKKKTKN